MTAIDVISEAAGHRVSPGDRLDSLGLDSLDFVDLLMRLDVDVAKFKGQTVADLIAAEGGC